MMNKKYDVIIIGAGIIGAATAYKLSLKDDSLKIAVIDKESEPNKHQTGRNSGVIHSGVYYPKDSLKSKNCINGYNQLIDFLNENKIEYKLTGKLIAAADETEFDEMDRLFNNAQLVGLDVEYLDSDQIKKIDKNLVAPKGFFVSETGITDYKEVLNRLIDLSSDKNVDYYFGKTLVNAKSVSQDTLQVVTKDETFETATLINCAGLQCDRVYELTTGKKPPVTIIPFKGEYFKVPQNSYSSDIPIYPVPNSNFPFLGVHLTRMIDGTLKVGPNAVLSFDREGYEGFQIDISDSLKIVTNRALYNIAKKYSTTVLTELLKHSSKSYFEQNVKKYWSNFSKEQIIGYTCGIRAQATENGELLSDFRIEKSGNQIHVLNAPSPAATSCLSIADTIISKLNLN
jgi:L-2-hydroxyglutarate oxidase